MVEKVILHIDMDCFFVSVERLYDARLIGKPVVVATDNRRSVVASASYEARSYGVRSAMPVVFARSKCPQLVIVPPQMERYQRLSERVFEVFERFTPEVERLGIDEGYLDVTGSLKLFGSPQEIAQQIRAAIRSELGVPCSVGIGPSKFVAKIASVKAKPDGVFAVSSAQQLQFLHSLPVAEMHGVGPKTVQKLHSRALHTVADVYQCSQQSLVRLLGTAMGEKLYRLARGIDEREIETGRQPKSISNESTFEYDTDDPAEITAALAFLAQKVARRLRQVQLQAGRVAVGARLADFTSLSVNTTLPNHTSSSAAIHSAALGLLPRLLNSGQKIRLLGVSVSNLTSPQHSQLALWEEPQDKRWENIDAVADTIAAKYQSAALVSARLLENTARGNFGNRGHAGGFRVVGTAAPPDSSFPAEK